MAVRELILLFSIVFDSAVAISVPDRASVEHRIRLFSKES